MLNAFESMARQTPMRVCFAAVDANGADVPYGYSMTRLMSAAISWRLQEFGALKGSYVMVDLPNLAIYPMLVLAAAYGGFGLALVDYNLSPEQKAARRDEFSRMLGEDLTFCVDKTNVMPLMRWAIDLLAGKETMRRDEGSLGANLSQRTFGGQTSGRMSLGFGKSQSQRNSTQTRASMSKSAQETCVHYADRQAHLFNPNSPAFVFATPDGRGKQKFVCHSWRSMLENAHTVNDVLCVDPMAVWQCVMPLWTVEGMQIVLRGLTGGNSFVLYQRFDPHMVLNDVQRYRATHISMDPARLGRLLQTGRPEIAAYQCILLETGNISRKIDPATLKNARRVSNHLRTAYSTPETAGMVAVEDDCITDDGSKNVMCAMRPLPGCTVRIMNPDNRGVGSIGVRTPCMFDGYLDGSDVRTRAGFYLTGDAAAMYKEMLYLQ